MISWKTIWRSLKNRDMQKRLSIVVGIIVVYRLLAHIPVPVSYTTSDAADDKAPVGAGGRRVLKKKEWINRSECNI